VCGERRRRRGMAGEKIIEQSKNSWKIGAPPCLLCQNIVYLQHGYRHVRIRKGMERGRGVVREVDNSCSSNPSYYNWLIILRKLL
jgi:hypothetical protein